jgi:hypothetical protein
LPSIDGNGGVTSFGEVRGWCLRGAAAGDQGSSEGKQAGKISVLAHDPHSLCLVSQKAA